MFKCNTFLPLMLAASVVLFCGCTVVREYPAEEKVETKKQAEFELANKLIRAFVTNDVSGFVELLPEETRARFGKKEFIKYRKQVIDSVGEPISYNYMTSLELPALTPQIWKVRFRRVNRKGDTEFTSEVLFKVVTGTDKKKQAVVTTFQFI